MTQVTVQVPLTIRVGRWLRENGYILADSIGVEISTVLLRQMDLESYGEIQKPNQIAIFSDSS